jgi:O-antigen/teichoic acid export membrane protein
MKQLLSKPLFEKFSRIHPRTLRAYKNIALGLSTKGGSLLASLLLVPLTIDYLSSSTYGTWLTISSVATMLMFFDIGIGNGLRNKFSEAVSNNNLYLAKSYVSTAYYTFGILQIVIILVFLIVSRFISWQKLFNTSISNIQLETIMLIMVAATSLKLCLDIVTYVLFALQKSGHVGIINLLSSVLVLASTYFLVTFSNSNIIYIVFATALSPLVVLGVSSIILFNKELKIYKPSIKLVNTSHIKNLLGLGYQFFLIQIAVVVIFYTDNLMIIQLFDSTAVTIYNISFKYFSLANIAFITITMPYWSAFTEAYSRGDITWMRQTYRQLRYFWGVLVIVVLLMIFMADTVYFYWIGERISIPFELNIYMGLYTVINCWNNAVVVITNGIGKIRLQLIYSTFSALINIPLIIIFSKTLGMGLSGVIFATCVSLLIGSIFCSIQADKILTRTATGIWNR